MYAYIFPVMVSLCDYLSVCVFSLGKKLTRQEDQKLFLALFGLIYNYQIMCGNPWLLTHGYVANNYDVATL